MTLESQTDDNEGTHLDSHADSPFVGQYCAIIRTVGRRISVHGFTDELRKPSIVMVVDAAVVYECEITRELMLLIIQNALHIKSMKMNLIPPFMMRLAGLTVNECPKFLSPHPNINNHSIYCKESNRRIPLELWGIISMIPTQIPRDSELMELNVFELTPMMNTWDPHT